MKLKPPEDRVHPLMRALLSVFMVYVVGAVSGGFLLMLGFIFAVLGDFELPIFGRLLLFGCGFCAGIVGMVLAVGESNG